MKRTLALFCLSVCFMLSACSSESSVVPTYSETIQIPVDDSEVFTMQVPGVDIVETDNNVYWKFSDGIELDITPSHTTVTEKQYGDTDTYFSKTTVSRKLKDDVTVSVNGSKKEVDKYRDVVAHGNLETSTVSSKPTTLKKLPDFEVKSDMEITENGLYMPAGSESTSGIYRAEILCNGSDYLESFIIDGDFESIKSKLVNIANANASGKSKEIYNYEGGACNIYYYEVGNHIIVAKMLTLNQWCVYSCTPAYLDYALTGATMVTR